MYANDVGCVIGDLLMQRKASELTAAMTSRKSQLAELQHTKNEFGQRLRDMQLSQTRLHQQHAQDVSLLDRALKQHENSYVPATLAKISAIEGEARAGKATAVLVSGRMQCSVLMAVVGLRLQKQRAVVKQRCSSYKSSNDLSWRACRMPLASRAHSHPTVVIR